MDLFIFDEYFDEKKTNNKIFINWNGEKINSILENNKEKLRSKYLEIISETIKKNSIKLKHLKLNNLCLTKMSLINEKNPFKSDQIYNCLKLLALEILIHKKRIKNIYYYGKNLNINKSLEYFSKNARLNYKRKYKKVYLNLKVVDFLKGNLFFIIQLIKNFNLSKNTKEYSKNSIFSYFVHFSTTKNKNFQSNLWGNLPKDLNLKKIKINWFHFYVPSNEVKNSKFANLIKNKFNKNSYENHNFINSYMSLNDFIKSYYLFLRFFIKNIFLLDSEINFFKNKHSNTNFCFFLKDDFNSSFFGKSLIYNIMNILTFDNLLKKIPKQDKGLYIIENQSWEYCFVKLWKKYNHGKLYAYFNSSARFWDLRYLKPKQKPHNSDENPHKYLINKYILKSEIKKFGYPMERVSKTDALRYIKLKEIKKIKKNKKILIVGDILFKETLDLIKYIDQIVDKLKIYKFYLKPHPTMTTKSINHFKNNYNYLNITNINSNNFKNFQFIICSNGTSANLDCMIMGLNFCSIKIKNSLNLFPVKKFEKKYQIKSHKDLISKIKNSKKEKNIFSQNNNLKFTNLENFFF